MIEGIKHIIFDLGGVLLNIDYNRTEQAFIDLGIKDFPAIYSQLQQTSLFDDYETGKISSEVFIENLKIYVDTNISEQQIISAWNAMLLDFPLRRLQILHQLRNQYDLILLSNTNAIHEEAFSKILMEQHSTPHIGVFFDKVYLSHKVGLRKPNVEIFNKILTDNGLKPEHTLFIDDSPQHIVGAKEANIRAIHLKKGMTIEKDIFKPKV